MEGALAAVQGHQQETLRLQKLLEDSKTKISYLETTVLEAGEKAIQTLQMELEETKLSLEISRNEKVQEKHLCNPL